ncbi:MAG: phosphotransferase [Anaerolineales bacterium]|nr:phosphotransferase [Anaerolineales bacterium]
MNLPKEFIQNIESVFEEDGKQFIKDFPSLIEDASSCWKLSNVQLVSNLSFNFVAYATSSLTPLLKGEGNNVVLKIGVPRAELISEIQALRLYDGNGACKLIEFDEEKGFLLLERLKPGEMLSELEDDDERTHIAIDVMQKIQCRCRVILPSGEETSPLQERFIKLSDWFDGLKNIRPHFDGAGPFPQKILERVESVLPELFTEKHVLLHGDFHHFNILSSKRGWLIIDPKGVIGPAGYEIGPLMLNPWGMFRDKKQFEVQTKRRVDIIKERTGWERESIINWALSHAILSAWWNFESNIEDAHSLMCAKIFSELK